jgi:hypothetical protein
MFFGELSTLRVDAGAEGRNKDAGRPKSRGCRGEVVSIEQLIFLLEFAATFRIQVELVKGIPTLAFLKVDGIDVVDPKQGQHEHAHIAHIDAVLLKQLVGFVDQNALL